LRDDWALETGIILYNYGCAYKCLDSVSTDPKYIAGAFQLFNFAYSAVCSRPRKNDNWSIRGNCKLLLMMFTLRHLVEISGKDSGLQDEHINYSRRFGLLLHDINRLNLIEAMLPARAARAA
jgi:hypothetical protein